MPTALIGCLTYCMLPQSTKCERRPFFARRQFPSFGTISTLFWRFFDYMDLTIKKDGAPEMFYVHIFWIGATCGITRNMFFRRQFFITLFWANLKRHKLCRIIRVAQAGKWNFEKGQKGSKMTIFGLKMIIFGHFSRFLAFFKISFSSLCHPTHNADFWSVRQNKFARYGRKIFKNH